MHRPTVACCHGVNHSVGAHTYVLQPRDDNSSDNDNDDDDWTPGPTSPSTSSATASSSAAAALAAAAAIDEHETTAAKFGWSTRDN